MRSVLFILGILCSFCVSADVFKCTAADGNTVYQSGPCGSGKSKVEINTKTGVSTDLSVLQNKQLSEQKNQQEQAQKQEAEKELIEEQKVQLKQDALKETEKNRELIRSNPLQFSAYAIPPYLPDALPPLVKNFQDRLPEIERLRRLAAQKSLASGKCGRVEADELNVKSTKTTLVFLVDCSSGKNFYYTERELAE